MRARFWGVRGSIPVPGPDTLRAGGNTPCVEVETADGAPLILDAGTGIRNLGLDLVQRVDKPASMLLLLTHTHWDHIQGLPFFAPIRLAGQRLSIMGEPKNGRSLQSLLEMQLDSAFQPISSKNLGAQVTYRHLEDGVTIRAGASTSVFAARLRHPGGVLGYRIESGGKSVVYATDIGHPPDGLDAAVVSLARDADLLIHDAHFVAEERTLHPDWGHSSWLEAVRVAQAAGVGQLALFHHAPERTDDELEHIEQEARHLFSPAFVAREGMTVAL